VLAGVVDKLRIGRVLERLLRKSPVLGVHGLFFRQFMRFTHRHCEALPAKRAGRSNPKFKIG
jgi:hypothetical protein